MPQSRWPSPLVRRKSPRSRPLTDWARIVKGRGSLTPLVRIKTQREAREKRKRERAEAAAAAAAAAAEAAAVAAAAEEEEQEAAAEAVTSERVTR